MNLICHLTVTKLFMWIILIKFDCVCVLVLKGLTPERKTKSRIFMHLVMEKYAFIIYFFF